MAKRGRPFTYQSEEERPATVSLRIPRDLYERMSHYTARHRQSVTELLLDGLKWRLEQDDPRQQSISDLPYYDNTAILELTKPVHLLDEGIPFDEDAAAFPAITTEPSPDLSYNDNTVIQECGNTVIQEKVSEVKETPTPHAPIPGQREGGKYKLNRRQARALRAKREGGVPIKALMEEYGLSKATVFRYLAAEG